MKKLYMIGNTHFDPVWLWKWDEAMSSITATFRSVFERMEEYPEFIYSFATPPVFEWIKNTSPELFEKIRKSVAEGRWELSEGWWVQADCYSAAGESYVRQGLYGQRYLKENFGKYSNTVFNIDSFGHSIMLPQILSGCGIKNYVFVRPEDIHIKLESPLFRWESPDGSGVSTYRVDEAYDYGFETSASRQKETSEDSMVVYGVTDHGGAPTRHALDEIRKNDNTFCSTVERFFDEHIPERIWKDEFVTGDFGVYANHTGIKSLNRKAEYAVLNAEKASVIAGEYDCDTIKKCWHDILFNQFHDILGGASIKDAYFDAENLYGRAISTAKEIMHYKLLKITNNIKMPGTNPDTIWNLVVWNLNTDECDEYIEAEVQWVHEFPWYDKGIELADENGNRYECQIIREKSVIPGFRSRFVFKAKIPAMGYKAFRVIKTEAEISQKTPEDYREIDTGKFIIRLNSERGGIESVFSKEKEQIICRNLLLPVCLEDNADTWAFNTDKYGDETGKFEYKGHKIIESGALRTVLKLTYGFGNSILDYYYTFFQNEDYADVKYKVNWNEKHIALKLMSDIDNCSHTASTPYGKVCRGEEIKDYPVGEWLRAGNISFAFDNIFAYNVCDKRLGLTVLRSPIYGDLRIKDIDFNTDYDMMEQGIKEGRIRIYFSENKNPQNNSIHFNNPPVVLCEACHDGALPGENSYVKHNSENVIISTVKACEDGDGVIIRGYETNGNYEKFSFSFKENQYLTEVRPFEIFTVKISDGDCFKVNMLEENPEA